MRSEATSVCGPELHREGDEELEEEWQKKELDVLETTYMLMCPWTVYDKCTEHKEEEGDEEVERGEEKEKNYQRIMHHL